jgi:hypothetical protein
MEHVGDKVDFGGAFWVIWRDGEPEAEDAALPVTSVDEADA